MNTYLIVYKQKGIKKYFTALYNCNGMQVALELFEGEEKNKDKIVLQIILIAHGFRK